MSGHTKGPWSVASGCEIRSAAHQIARVWMFAGGQGKANARLIAAAPELLEALEITLNQYECLLRDCGLSSIDTINKSRAAIAKAKGEEV